MSYQQLHTHMDHMDMVLAATMEVFTVTHTTRNRLTTFFSADFH